MKHYLLILILAICIDTYAQDFFRNEYDKNRNYVLLANPTKQNIQTVQFLLEKKLLKVPVNKVHFVGVYHQNQTYNFEETAGYIKEKGLLNFGLHELREPLIENELFTGNNLTDELSLLFGISSGIFFFGGPDIPPSVYGEENTTSVVTDPERHYFEATFLFHLLGGYQNDSFTPLLEENPDYFITGFCLGLQTMNVATGGTLVQDIPEEIYNADTPEETLNSGKENMHRNYWHKITDDPQLTRINFHTIHFTENPFFTNRVKADKLETPLVYSSHHQAVEKIGKGLEVTAYSADSKIVEGLTHEIYPNVFSVQFHPEVPALYENRDSIKFAPEDEPVTFHRALGKKSLRFHKKYWKYISKALKQSMKNNEITK